MNTLTLMRIILLSIAVALGIYLVAIMSDSSMQKQDTEPTLNTTAPALKASKLREYQACLDRANNSDAQQAIIDEAIRKCEILYKPE